MRILPRFGALSVLASVLVVTPSFAQNTTTRISVSTAGVGGNSYSQAAAISADGRYVAFVSAATNLVAGDTNNQTDIFVHDRQTGATQRVNLAQGFEQAIGGFSANPAISADGRYVAFTSSATNLVGNDTNNQPDVFVRDLALGVTTRVSVATGGGQGSRSAAYPPAISPDGRYVVFNSDSPNLVADDTNNDEDVFLRDRQMGTTVRVSVTNGGAEATSGSYRPVVSADGRYVAFESFASNLVPGDTNGTWDVFVRDRQAGTTTRVNVGPGGLQATFTSFAASISHDGRFIAFRADGTLQPGAGPGAYVHDRQTGITTLLMRGGFAPKLSGDGRQACVRGVLVFGAVGEAVLVDRQTLTKTRLVFSTSGDPGNSYVLDCSINEYGTLVALSSDASNLVPNDFNSDADVFVRTTLATVAADQSTMRFGATTNGGMFVSQTAPQLVRLSQSGVGTVTWTAVSDQPWLEVSPASGTGSGILAISVTPAMGLPPNGTVTGHIVITLTGAVNAIPPLTVTLALTPNGSSTSPVGVVDTPVDHRTGVTGAVPFTGWALDDIEVTRVSICRAAFGGEVPPTDPNCGGAAEIFVGFAVFIDGARPDVASAFPALPLSSRAGWGFMVLTNMLPGQGNGTYQFTMRAQDREGSWVVLGTRTMTCANASATLPFGTLDTPFQGGTVSGTSYVNFGWALTPLPKTIPIDGSTIRVLVDGVDVGPADYNHVRSDIQALFPNFNNTTGTNGAVGFKILDTTALSNGLHTISWAVTDSAGAIEGLGSRFFTVTNGGGAVTAASTSASPIEVDGLPMETTPVAGRRGWDLEAAFGFFRANANGVTVIRSEEVNRVELQLGDGDYAGYLRTPSGLTPLPIGSRLDRATKAFTWAPGVGFIGSYHFVFVRSTSGRAVSRREIRIVLHPKGRGSVGPQVVIDLPRAHAVMHEPFMVGGWAVDLDATEGTGVTTLHAWAFPVSGGVPTFLGATAYGSARPDVAAVHGDRFKDSGFGLIAEGLSAGDYDLALFAWSTETAGFVAPQVVRISVRR